MNTLLLRRRGMGAHGEWHPTLPTGYSLLAGATSNGAYIRTIDYSPLIDHEIGVHAVWDGTNRWWFGLAGIAGSLGSCGIAAQTIRFSTGTSGTISFPNGNNIVSMNRHGFKINAREYFWQNPPNTINASQIFPLYKAENSSLAASGTMYNFFVRDVDTKEYIVNMYSCERDSDHVVGFYDIARDLFFTPTNGNLTGVPF